MTPDSAADVRVGIVGCGSITRNVHLPVLLSLPGVHVAWLADVDAAVGAALSRASGVAFKVIADPLSLPDADLVLLALPNGYREGYYEYFDARPEVSLYIEKPIAKSLEEHMRIEGSRAPWQVSAGLDRRSFGLTRLARELFATQPFGKPVSATVEFGGQGRVLSGGGFMSSATAAGGGPLFQMGVHFIDALLFASAATDVAIKRGRMLVNHGLDIHVEAEMTFLLPGDEDIPVQVRVTQLQPADNRVEVVFERATVRFSIMYGSRAIHVVPRSGGAAWNLVPEAGSGPLDVFASFGCHWSNALEAVRSRAENYTSASQARLTSKALGLLYALETEAA